MFDVILGFFKINPVNDLAFGPVATPHRPLTSVPNYAARWHIYTW